MRMMFVSCILIAIYTLQTNGFQLFGRQFEIVRQFEFGKREIEELRQAVSGKCNLTVRNFPVSVDALRKKLRLKEGGDAYVFATTIGARKVLLLCRKVKVEE